MLVVFRQQLGGFVSTQIGGSLALLKASAIGVKEIKCFFSSIVGLVGYHILT